MRKALQSGLSLIVMASVLSACSPKPSLIVPPVYQNNNVVKTFSSNPERPVFNKKRLGTAGVNLNSVNEQKKNQTKLHTFYFKHYSGGADSYQSGSVNEHMRILTKAESQITQSKLDSNGDRKITLNEILSFVTSNAYIKYFRETFILYSFKKLDKNSDNKLNMNEFSQFNKTIKAKELPDFQLLEEFDDYDYNSSRDLDVEEYEDFFMEYLLIKVGASK